MPTASPLIQHVRCAAFLRPSGELTDGELLELFLTHHDEAAFAAIVQRHGPMVLGVCRRVLRDAHDAEDAFQATFLVLVRRAAAVAPRDRLGNWLHGVAYRTALKARSLAARRQAKEREGGTMPRTEPPGPPAWDDLQARLDQEVSRLPAHYRDAVVLCDLEGKSRRDAARELGLAEGTLSSRLNRAHHLLARRLGASCHGLTAAALADLLQENLTAAALPNALVAGTVKAGTGVLAGHAALVSANVAAITEGVLQAMFIGKVKNALLVLLVVGFVALCVGAFGGPALARLNPDDEPAVAAAPDEEAEQQKERTQKPKPKAKPAPEAKPKEPDRTAEAIEILEKSFATKRAPRLVVETFNGDVEVKTGAAGATKARVVKSARAATKEAAEEDLKKVEVQLTLEADTIRVTAKQLDPQAQTNRATSVLIVVPPDARLDLRSSNGKLTASGPVGAVKAATSNGSIEVKDTKGALELRTSNGAIDVKGAKGKVDVKTSNGGIRFAGSLDEGSHTFQTSNGNVTLTLPAGSKFSLDGQTSNGKVTTSFPLSKADGKRKTSLKGDVGDNPAVRLKLRTSNGNIDVGQEKSGGK